MTIIKLIIIATILIIGFYNITTNTKEPCANSNTWSECAKTGGART
jgi:hypothetical protein